MLCEVSDKIHDISYRSVRHNLCRDKKSTKIK
jgi:hypothetical protein